VKIKANQMGKRKYDNEGKEDRRDESEMIIVIRAPRLIWLFFWFFTIIIGQQSHFCNFFLDKKG